LVLEGFPAKEAGLIKEGDKKKYNSALTVFFKVKIIAAFITLFSCFISLVWFLKDPAVLHSCYAWLFILINVAMVAAAGVAGFLGGKLVFKD